MSNTDTKIILRRLAADQTLPFLLEPDANARAAIAQTLGLVALRKLRFEGTIAPTGKRDWALDAKLGATVTQPCVVTLDPVTTRIDDKVTRIYLSQATEHDEGTETEMPEDDRYEPIPEVLDLTEVMTEALALSLPLYPRAQDADLENSDFAPPGVAPIRGEDVKPFAGLASLRDKLTKDDEND